MTPRQTTEDLIRQLAASPAPRPFHAASAAVGMLALLAVALGLFWLVFGLRADLASAWSALAVQAKTALLLLLAILAVRLALGSSRPGERLALWPLALPVLLALLMVLLRVPQVPEGGLLPEMVGQTALACLASITLLSALPLAAGIVLLRRAAPTRPALTGALLGLAAGAGTASGYALHCTEDSPLFFVSWYGLATVIVALCGALLGRRFLRW